MKKKYCLAITILLTLSFNTKSFAENQKLKHLLTMKDVPNGLLILPKPPTYTSVEFLNDQAQYHKGYSLKDTKRWKTAQKDAYLAPSFTNVRPLAKQFSEAFGEKISPETTPSIYRILQEILYTTYLATEKPKDYYMRTRPFVFYEKSTCYPESEKKLRVNGSYPSGHTTLGWATALVLSEINPNRQNNILQRGNGYGQSRVICGAHWQSDVDAGKIMGAAIITRLRSEPGFQKWIEQAKKEYKKMVKVPTDTNLGKSQIGVTPLPQQQNIRLPEGREPLSDVSKAVQNISKVRAY